MSDTSASTRQDYTDLLRLLPMDITIRYDQRATPSFDTVSDASVRINSLIL